MYKRISTKIKTNKKQKMKSIKSMMLIPMMLFLGASILFTSCKKETKDDQPKKQNNEVEGLKLTATIENDNHKINLYTLAGKLQTGYNEVYFQIKNADGSLVNNATATWIPMMHMTGMSHSCPASEIVKKVGAENTYVGNIVFQMASNDMEYWELTLNYAINGKDYTATGKITVETAPKQVVKSFKGSDSSQYVIAMVEPSQPKIGVNDMKVVLYKKKSMNEFQRVEGFKIKIDPRMPDMGNHSSPNNIDLVEDCCSGIYVGKVNFTMTGYWAINLIVMNASDTVIKGEKIEGDVKSSSLFFDVEF